MYENTVKLFQLFVQYYAYSAFYVFKGIRNVSYENLDFDPSFWPFGPFFLMRKIHNTDRTSWLGEISKVIVYFYCLLRLSVFK